MRAEIDVSCCEESKVNVRLRKIGHEGTHRRQEAREPPPDDSARTMPVHTSVQEPTVRKERYAKADERVRTHAKEVEPVRRPTRAKADEPERHAVVGPQFDLPRETESVHPRSLIHIRI